MKRTVAVVTAAALAALGFVLAGVLQAAPAPQTVNVTVGPGFTIAAKKGSRAVTSLTPGTYRFLVKDLAATHNAHLTGPGVNRKTAVAAKATATWTLTLRPGLYRLVCDAHPTSMKRALRVAASRAGTTGGTQPPTETAPTPYPTDTDY